MDYLFTPWRYHYVTGGDREKVDREDAKRDECIFCAAPAAGDDEKALIVSRAQYTYVIVNRFPYTSGHVMVVPYQHVATLEELAPDAGTEMMRLARDCERALRSIYNPDGLNFGLNIGKSAGAGVAGHLHLHALPRWTGDVNFMTSVSETRVLPEDLGVTWRRLRAAFA